MSDCNVGGRKNRSIRDNLFILYAAINDALAYQKIEIDIQFYDLSQAFDSMWYEETMNDFWESLEVKDDKFALICEMNREVDLFVKTPVGETDVFTMEKIEQQGTVLAPLKCSNQMDSISRECLRENIEMFKYRNVVTIPPLGMIDDLSAIAKCGSESIILNAVINAKINLKKLEFNQTKCVNLHVSKDDRKKCSPSGVESERMRNVKCVFLEVQDCEMRTADNEKYIGDIVSYNGSNDANVARRVSLGMGALSQIFAVLNEISLGYQFIEIGLILRDSILLSKMLLSAESWHKLFKYQIEKFEEVDKTFFRKLFNSHSKTGLEFYFSETGTVPVDIRISMRRLSYWWHVLNVDKSEMIFRVYAAQKLSPVSGDWIHLLETDKRKFQIEMSDSEVSAISKQKFKNYIKKKAEELTIQFLAKLAMKHSKSDQLDVEDLSISPYLTDCRFSKEERELLFKLRSKTVDVKQNFPNAYLNNDMLCDLCKLFTCTQSHPLQCPKLSCKLVIDGQLQLSDTWIYGPVEQQLLYIKIYTQFWKLREEELNKLKNSAKSQEIF
jgi:hypothetical protein